VSEQVKRWKPEGGGSLYECDANGKAVYAKPCWRRIKAFDSAGANLVDGADYDALQSKLDSAVEALTECSEYFHDIPEAAVGGDDAAIALARKLRATLARLGIDTGGKTASPEPLNDLYRQLVVRGYAQHEADYIASGPHPADDLSLFALSVLTNISDATPETHPDTYRLAQDYADAWRARQPLTKELKP
jgi:hypothetical protein